MVKVYIARDGYFKDVDIVLHWHPDDTVELVLVRVMVIDRHDLPSAESQVTQLVLPKMDVSALDGVEAMNMMVNMMREHMDEEARIHYIITKGGLAPNVVPDVAEAYYYVRHPSPDGVRALFERVVKTANGAAEGTETKMSYEIMHGNYPVIANEIAFRLANQKLNKLGGASLSYTKEEQKFAEELYQTLVNPDAQIGDQTTIQPMVYVQGKGSSDVGDVSWMVPTTGVRVATWVPGTSALLMAGCCRWRNIYWD